jgi:hypothetical protein
MMPLLFPIPKALSRAAYGILFSTIFILLSTVRDSPAEAQTAPRPVGRMNFWFHSATAASDFVAGDHRGVTSITYAGAPAPLLNTMIHAAHMAVVGGIGGVISLKRITIDEILNFNGKNPTIDKLVKEGVDALYVDEPVGPALLNECGPDCYDAAHYQATDRGVKFIVAAMNKTGDYFRFRLPGGKFGICVGDGGGVPFHIMALRAGLREDFACLEEYGGAHYHPFDALKKEFPAVETMLLVYNTRALCSGNEITAFDTWGFWNLDSYQGWIPGPRGDADWFENAKRFARGDTGFCMKPVSQITAPLTHDTQTRDFSITPLDTNMTRPSAFTLGKCEYKVVSNDHETVSWHGRDCNKPFLVTVGPGQDCRDNGTTTCFVYVRAWTSKNELGDAQYEKFSIAY